MRCERAEPVGGYQDEKDVAFVQDVQQEPQHRPPGGGSTLSGSSKLLGFLGTLAAKYNFETPAGLRVVCLLTCWRADACCRMQGMGIPAFLLNDMLCGGSTHVFYR